jgi:hypothetical protein
MEEGTCHPEALVDSLRSRVLCAPVHVRTAHGGGAGGGGKKRRGLCVGLCILVMIGDFFSSVSRAVALT